MAMKRRSFIRSILMAGAILGTPILKLVPVVRPVKWLEAVRRYGWKGRIVALDERVIRRPGRWAG